MEDDGRSFMSLHSISLLNPMNWTSRLSGFQLGGGSRADTLCMCHGKVSVFMWKTMMNHDYLGTSFSDKLVFVVTSRDQVEHLSEAFGCRML